VTVAGLGFVPILSTPGRSLRAAFARDNLSPQAAVVAKAIEEADALVVCTPAYEGSYTEQFIIDPAALASRPSF
jgi:FMN reductase